MASALDNHSKLAARLSMSGTRPAAIDAFRLPFQPGEVIGGKYKIIRLIGTGGVGFVVSARHVGFDELVALKFLRPEFATHTEAVTRFTIEARASFKIKSEHVARVLDVDTLPDGTPFIAMELLEGTDMRRLLDRCRVLAIEPAVDYGLQTCEALAAAHALHIIHRDIKPENLFLTGCGADTDQVKVLDFGISKVALTGNRRQTHQALTRVAVGTPPYMSPEQVRASSDLDARSDIWSVGCVLYELLTGTAPFDRMSLMQSCAAVLEEEPVPPRDLRPALSRELEAVVISCLQKDPAARYQDVAELAEALAPFGSGRLVNYPERCRSALSGALNSDGSGRRSTPSDLAARVSAAAHAARRPAVSAADAARRPPVSATDATRRSAVSATDATRRPPVSATDATRRSAVSATDATRRSAVSSRVPTGPSASTLRRLTGASDVRVPMDAGHAARRLPTGVGAPSANSIDESYTRALRQPSNSQPDVQSGRPTLLLEAPAPNAAPRWYMSWPAGIAFGIGAVLAFGTAYRLSHESPALVLISPTAPGLPRVQVPQAAPIAVPPSTQSPAPPVLPVTQTSVIQAVAIPVVQPPLAASDDVLPGPLLPVSAPMPPEPAAVSSSAAPPKPKPKSRSAHATKPMSASRFTDEPDVGF